MQKFLVAISNAWKYMVAIAGFGGLVWGGFQIYDTIITTQEMVVDVWDNQNLIEQNQKEHFVEIKDSLDRLEGKIDKNTANLEGLERAWAFERSNRELYTQEQLNTIIEELLKKNDKTSLRANDREYDITFEPIE